MKHGSLPIHYFDFFKLLADEEAENIIDALF